MNRHLLVLFTMILLLQGLSSAAQLKGFSIGPYLEFANPRGDFAATNRNGLGAGLSADIKLPGKLSATGSFGYLRFSRASGNGEASAVSAFPVRAGLKYRLPIVYLKLESGAARYSKDAGSALILSPGIGIRVLGLDVQGNFETWLGDEGRSFLALKLAYHF